MPKLLKDSNIPLYHQLALIFRSQIRSKVFKPGEKFPTERDLMKKFEVSRNTVRLAIRELETEGLVKRDQGRGTFVSEPKLKLGVMRLTGFSEDMQERNLYPSTKLLKGEVVHPPQEIAKLLKLFPNETTLYIERLRYANGIPMAINISYFAAQSFPGFVEEDFSFQSIYAILENKYGVHITKGEQVIRAKNAMQQEAELLQISTGDAILIVEGVIFSDNGMPIEYMKSIYRSDRYEFFVNPVRIPK